MASDRSGGHCAGTITILESLWRRWHSPLSILALPREEPTVGRGLVTRSWEGACGRQQTAERACVTSGSLAPPVMAVLVGWRGLLGYWHHGDLSGYFPAVQWSPLPQGDSHYLPWLEGGSHLCVTTWSMLQGCPPPRLKAFGFPNSIPSSHCTCSYLSYISFLSFFFLCEPFFKVVIDFVTVFLLFYALVLWPQGMWDLSPPTRDRTHTPYTERWNFNHWTTREVPTCPIFLITLSVLWVKG